jgi:hypothetical protein
VAEPLRETEKNKQNHSKSCSDGQWEAAHGVLPRRAQSQQSEARNSHHRNGTHQGDATETPHSNQQHIGGSEVSPHEDVGVADQRRDHRYHKHLETFEGQTR